MYSALNVGFTLGALMGGFALAFHSNDVLHALPWFTAMVFLVNAAAVTRLPRASHDDRTPEDRKVKIAGPGPLPAGSSRRSSAGSSGPTRCC